MDRFKGDINAKGRCQVGKRSIAFVMKTDDFIHAAVFEIILLNGIDNLWKPFANHGIFCKMEPHDVAENIASRDGGNAFIQFSPDTSQQHREKTHVNHRFCDLLSSGVTPWDHHAQLLFGQRHRCRQDAQCLLPLYNLIKRMILVRAIFFTGIACYTCLKGFCFFSV